MDRPIGSRSATIASSSSTFRPSTSPRPTTATSRSLTRWPGAAAPFSPPSAGVLFLADSLSGLAQLAIAIVVAGLASLVGPGVSRVALLWAGLTAATIGTYTTLDAAGARRSSGLGYGIAIVLGAGLVLLIAWQ